MSLPAGPATHAIFLSCILLLTSGIAVAQSSGADTPDDVMVRFVEAWETDDTETVTSLLADDVILIDDADVVTGRESVGDWLGSRMSATGAFEFVPERSETNDTFAYQTGDWSLTRGEGAALGEHTIVFEQNGEADWLLAAMHLQRDVVNAEGSGNNAFATAFGIGLDQPVRDRISEPGQLDHFEILVPESGVLDIALEPVPSDQRLAIHVFDDEQNRIASGVAANPGGRGASSARVEPGRYYVRVKPRRGSTPTSDEPYTLTVSLDRTDIHEINDTFAQAAEIEIGELVVGTIRPEDADYYKLNVPSPGSYRLALDPTPPELRMTLAVFDETQQRIAGSDAGQAGRSTFLDSDLLAGVAYVRVMPRRGQGDSTEPYTLRITRK